MPKLYPEALAFCYCWSALAVAALVLVGIRPASCSRSACSWSSCRSSALILSRTSNFVLEKAVRWGILVVAALAVLSARAISAPDRHPGEVPGPQ